MSSCKYLRTIYFYRKKKKKVGTHLHHLLYSIFTNIKRKTYINTRILNNTLIIQDKWINPTYPKGQ